MDYAQTQLARRRLMLGITNVGFWVLAAAGGLWELPRCSPDRFTSRGCVLVLAGAVAAQAGFDFVGGFVLMPPPGPSVRRFLLRWLRGASTHTLVLGAVGLLSDASFRLTGGFAPAVLAATVGLALTRRSLLSVAGGTAAVASTREGETVFVATAPDPAFTGGIVGWGKRATSLLPAAWLNEVPAAEVAAELHRRRWQIGRGLPGRAVGLILGWNVLGAVVGSLVLGYAGRTAGQALLMHACWMTLWTFGSLLLLPGLSRQAVFAADRAVLDADHNPRAWIERFPNLVGEDGAANGLVQTIFYPVPSARERLWHLPRPAAAGFVPGNLARDNLYYSWAGCTLLGAGGPLQRRSARVVGFSAFRMSTVDGVGGEDSVGGFGRPEKTRTRAALASAVFTVGFALVCARTAGSDGRSAALLVAVNFIWFGGFAAWSGDPALGRLLLAALVCGWTELLADALCVRCTGTLDYSTARSAMILESPWWMPLLWAVVAMQIGLVGDVAIRRFGKVCSVLLTGGLGAVLIPVYEHLAWGAHWWRYRRCLLIGHVPVYIVVAEAVIGVGLALLGYLVLRGGSWWTAVALGMATGAWMILGGVVGWGTVEFLGRDARPLWPFP